MEGERVDKPDLEHFSSRWAPFSPSLPPSLPPLRTKAKQSPLPAGHEGLDQI